MAKPRLCQHCLGSGYEIDHAKTGASLRRKRKAVNMSLRDMAKLLKVSAPYLSDLELGRRAWSSDRVAAFEDYCRLYSR